VRERLGSSVRDLSFDRGTMQVPTLSPQHLVAFLERTAGPIIKVVETLSAHDPEKLRTFRSEVAALATEYLAGNIVSQGYLLTRAVKA